MPDAVAVDRPIGIQFGPVLPHDSDGIAREMEPGREFEAGIERRCDEFDLHWYIADRCVHAQDMADFA